MAAKAASAPKASHAAFLGGAALVPALVAAPLVATLLFAERPTVADLPDPLMVAVALSSFLTVSVVPLMAGVALAESWRWSRLPRDASPPGDGAKTAFGAAAALLAGLIAVGSWLAVPVYVRVID